MLRVHPLEDTLSLVAGSARTNRGLWDLDNEARSQPHTRLAFPFLDEMVVSRLGQNGEGSCCNLLGEEVLQCHPGDSRTCNRLVEAVVAHLQG